MSRRAKKNYRYGGSGRYGPYRLTRNGAGVAGVRVRAFDQDRGRLIFETRSDPDGWFVFERMTTDRNINWLILADYKDDSRQSVVNAWQKVAA